MRSGRFPSASGASLRAPGSSAAASVLLLAASLLLFPGSGAAQSIAGRVLLADHPAAQEWLAQPPDSSAQPPDSSAPAPDSLGVADVELRVTDLRGTVLARAQSDHRGAFRLPLPGPGTFRLVARRIGLTPLERTLDVGDEEVTEVELWMAEEAIPLEPLVVVARRRIREGTLDEFYDRMAHMKQAGRGWFMTREEIEASPHANSTFLLHQSPHVYLRPGDGSRHSVLMRRGGRLCTPALYIDGMPASFDRLPNMIDMEGIEVYRARWEHVPGYWNGDCGTIFIWRRPDWGNPFKWSTLLFAGALGGLGWALGALLL